VSLYSLKENSLDNKNPTEKKDTPLKNPEAETTLKPEVNKAEEEKKKKEEEEKKRKAEEEKRQKEEEDKKKKEEKAKERKEKIDSFMAWASEALGEVKNNFSELTDSIKNALSRWWNSVFFMMFFASLATVILLVIDFAVDKKVFTVSVICHSYLFIVCSRCIYLSVSGKFSAAKSGEHEQETSLSLTQNK
jgi:cation transport ATPase